MTISKSAIAIKPNQNTVEDIFSDLEPLTPFEVKRDSVATQLTALMLHCNKTRTDMAEQLGWQKSRVTKVLSGNENLTIKTICEFSGLLGYDFDVVFHGANEPTPKQPWQLQQKEKQTPSIDVLRTLTLPINKQSASEVAIDLLTGNAKETYFSFDTRPYDNIGILPAITNELVPRKTLTIPSSTSIVPSKMNIHFETRKI